MSGLYNSMFRYNKYADEITRMLGLERGDFGRFRDAYVSGDQILVYTRIGGGNRQSYEEIIKQLRTSEYFVTDYDEPKDETYAYFLFNVPGPYRGRAKEIAKQQGEVLTIGQKFDKLNEPGAMEKLMKEGHPGVTETMNMLKSLLEGKVPTTIFESENFRGVAISPEEKDEMRCSCCESGSEIKCDYCNMTPEQRLENEEKERLAYEKYGFIIHYVPDEGKTANVHTHGLEKYHNHLDLQIRFDIDPRQAVNILHTLVEKIKRGQAITDGLVMDDILAGDYVVKAVKATECDRDVMRILLPDRGGRLPDDPECEEFYRIQMED